MGFLYCGLCEADFKMWSGTSTHTSYIQRVKTNKHSSWKKHHTRDTGWLRRPFSRHSTNWSLLTKSELFILFCFFFLQRMKISPVWSGEQCKGDVCGLMFLSCWDRVTVILQSSLLESANHAETNETHSGILKNTQTNVKVSGKKKHILIINY